MNMQQHLDTCKRRAHQIKADHPSLGYMKRLDIAAQEQGFKHYTVLQKLFKLLGPDAAPSRIAIVRAGGNESDSPYRQLTAGVGIAWRSATPATDSR
ncbi:hypothetical protein [Sinimarinibacterium flocculans]|uniref:Uncharacterized protein n=1 Tax=Sinimarinibacterium flocculans TaxID=985250 RepID=A0A318EBW8_9GAMM|nr:hypothetical protein [Sinimarinibacterium flocculans]PXV67248.1 hypothetical protein C8D93_106226 [Sinimarinibacterium flocculans]HBG31532.1 hypothetical protein [Gammaproteobacteria bacterium]